MLVTMEIEIQKQVSPKSNSFLENNSSLLVILLSSLIVLAVLGVGVSYWLSNREKAAFNVFSADIRALNTEIKAWPEDSKEIKPEQLSKAQVFVDSILKQAKLHSGREATAQAIVDVMGAQLKMSQPELAIKTFEENKSNLNSSGLGREAAYFIYGNLLAAQSDCSGAQNIWKELDLPFFKEEAKLKTAECLVYTKKDLELAKRLLSELETSKSVGSIYKDKITVLTNYLKTL